MLKVFVSPLDHAPGYRAHSGLCLIRGRLTVRESRCRDGKYDINLARCYAEFGAQEHRSLSIGKQES